MNYGNRFEQQLLNMFIDNGYVGVRTHLSRVIDVIVWNEKEVIFIEAKATRAKKPRSYRQDILLTKALCAHAGCKSNIKFYFVIRLRGNKQIWIFINEMKIDKDRTTYNYEEACKWLKRKNF